MRPQQQNRRMRGRNNGGNNNNNNNNRKGPNPLSRNYESNGPDVKIRGSAQQIAEKYAALARDAMSSGDRVIAENYLQHAEHYNRIIAAAQAQMPIQNTQPSRDDFDDEIDEDNEAEAAPVNGAEAPATAANGSGPQPEIEGVPAEVALNTETPGENRGSREGGRNRERAGGRGERRPREVRPKDKEAGEEAAQVEVSAPAVAEEPAAVPAQPAADLSPAALAAAAEVKEAEADAPAKPRRPRKPRVTAAAKEAVETESAETPVSEG